ncbi:MAG: 30S ribosome-binding factor RbfA [Candidatus Sericytochromatia bacterium]|nr:30S ribosome-binding factor RbfA [Candidatus Sericytochromatia bacterium]
MSAHGRADRMAEAIRRLVAEMLQFRLKDQRIVGMVSVTDVEVSRDLRHAKVFVSVYGDEEQEKLTLEGLKSAAGRMRGEIGRELQLRHAPELVFRLDRTARHAAQLNDLFARIRGHESTGETGPDERGA